MRKYVIGYERGSKFVILFDSNNLQLAILMADKYKVTRKEKIKIKKRLDK